MQEKYTENIDQLDSFYQDAFQEASIEPPTEMWDKIRTSYSEQKKPTRFFTKKTTTLLLLLLLLISAMGLFLYFKNTKQQEKTGTVNKEQDGRNKGTQDGELNDNKETEAEKREDTNKETGNRNKQQVEENNTKETGTGNDKLEHNNSTENPTSTVGDVVKNPTPVTLGEEPKIKPDTASLPKETPKKKMSFREKHTQNIKSDSLRPLFVPVK